MLALACRQVLALALFRWMLALFRQALELVCRQVLELFRQALVLFRWMLELVCRMPALVPIAPPLDVLVHQLKYRAVRSFLLFPS